MDTPTVLPAAELDRIVRAAYKAARKVFQALLPDGTTKQRTSHTMNYTHAVAQRTADGAWWVRHWCGSRVLAAKAERRALVRIEPGAVLAVVSVEVAE